MNSNQEYFIIVTLLGAVLFIDAFLIYGRFKRKPLTGNYKPGSADYHAFTKIVHTTRYFIIAAIATILLILGLAVTMRNILNSSAPHDILIAAPIVVIISFVVGLTVVPRMMSKK